MRFHQTALLVFYSLFPACCTASHHHGELKSEAALYIADCITIPAKKIPLFLMDPSIATGQNGTMGFFVPHVFPLAAPFILFRLKRQGFSGCRVTVQEGGLLVKATR